MESIIATVAAAVSPPATPAKAGKGADTGNKDEDEKKNPFTHYYGQLVHQQNMLYVLESLAGAGGRGTNTKGGETN